jgi:RNA polymerase sigma-70 factor (ECF subfamily)
MRDEPARSTDGGELWGDSRVEQSILKHKASLLAQARRMCHNLQDAEDLVQETFLRLAGTSFTFKSDAACRAWLGRTLTHLFVDRCRKLSSQQLLVDDPSSLENVPVAPEPLLPYERLTRQHLEKAVELLSPRRRETFDLHARTHSHAEIARVLHIKEETVRKRLHDARKALRESLLHLLDEGEGD